MNIYAIIEIAYFLIGIILAYIWWKNEYEIEYEYEKEYFGVDEPMAVLLLTAFVFFWPIKLIKNYFEGFVD